MVPMVRVGRPQVPALGVLVRLPLAEGLQVSLDLSAPLVDGRLRGGEHLQPDDHELDLDVQLVGVVQDLDLQTWDN